MNSPATTPSSSLSAQLRLIGLRAVPADLDDFLSRATKSRWSPQQLIEQLVRAETDERSRRSMERRLRYTGIKGFKPMADFDWTWPTRIERDVIERALTLDFLSESRNLVLVGRNGLGKTMIAQNVCHAAVLAGSSVWFRSAPALLEDLHRQTPEGRRRKLSPINETGSGDYDDHRRLGTSHVDSWSFENRMLVEKQSVYTTEIAAKEFAFLKEAYGPPALITKLPQQNAFGAKWNDTLVTWHLPGGTTLYMKELGGPKDDLIITFISRDYAAAPVSREPNPYLSK